MAWSRKSMGKPNELAARIHKSVDVRVLVVVFEAGQTVLPARAVIAQLKTAEQVVLVRGLAGVRRKRRKTIELRLPLYPRAAVEVANTQTQRQLVSQADANVSAFQRNLSIGH